MKNAQEIIDYLESPPETGETGVLGHKVEFSERELIDAIDGLDEKNTSELLERVVTVCEQWNVMRVAPNNDIGAVARFQTARVILELP